jgi:hypothetical protein
MDYRRLKALPPLIEFDFSAYSLQDRFSLDRSMELKLVKSVPKDNNQTWNLEEQYVVENPKCRGLRISITLQIRTSFIMRFFVRASIKIVDAIEKQ